MKRLFFSALALALGSIAFISCNDEDKIKNDGQDEKYMTVPEQQQAIQASLEGVADAIQFTEFSEALNAVSELTGMKFEQSDLLQIITSPEVLEDSLFQVKMSKAAMMFTGDSVILDLTPFYMSADLNISDTVIVEKTRGYDDGGNVVEYEDSILKPVLVLSNINHDVDLFQLNVLFNDHKVELKAKTKAGENTIVNTDEDGTKLVVLPETIEISITLDNEVLASYNGNLKSDMSLFAESKDGETTLKAEGSKASVAGTLKVLSYELGGSFNYEMSKGIDGSFFAKYAGADVLAGNAKLDAVFDGLDINDTVAVLAWAQDPNQLKAVSGNISLGGGQIEIKGSLENPFKDKDLAKYMGTLMTGTILSDEEFEDMVAKFNELFKVGVYFKGHNQPQAVLKVKYTKKADRNDGDLDDEDKSLIDVMGAAIMRAGGYLVFVAHDADGNEVEVSPQEYFGGIDPSQFTRIITEKALQVFGPYMQKEEAR